MESVFGGQLFLGHLVRRMPFVCSRRIVCRSMQERMTSQLVQDALMRVMWRRRNPVTLLHHLEQGGRHTSSHFLQLLREQGITCCISRAGDV